MRVTKRQRAQVVELLRCAADRCIFDDTFAFGWTRSALGLRQGGKIHNLTCRALTETVGLHGFDWRRDLLEAAARVEEGSWP